MLARPLEPLLALSCHLTPPRGAIEPLLLPEGFLPRVQAETVPPFSASFLGSHTFLRGTPSQPVELACRAYLLHLPNVLQPGAGPRGSARCQPPILRRPQPLCPVVLHHVLRPP